MFVSEIDNFTHSLRSWCWQFYWKRQRKNARPVYHTYLTTNTGDGTSGTSTFLDQYPDQSSGRQPITVTVKLQYSLAISWKAYKNYFVSFLVCLENRLRNYNWGWHLIYKLFYLVSLVRGCLDCDSLSFNSVIRSLISCHCNANSGNTRFLISPIRIPASTHQ